MEIGFDLGLKIKLAREKKRISQRKLAKMLEISNTELSNIEKGSRKKIDDKILRKSQNILEIDLGYKNLSSLNFKSISEDTDYQQFLKHQKKQREVKFQHLREKVCEEIKRELEKEYIITKFSKEEIPLLRPENFFGTLETGGESVIGISTYLINTSNEVKLLYTHQQIEERVKALFIDFYFYYKKKGYTDDKIRLFAGFVVNEEFDKKELNRILNKIFASVIPMFSFKIYLAVDFE